MPPVSSYYDEERLAKVVAEGRHRDAVGGLWDDIGRHQFEFLVAQGLKPHHRFLDVGCGCLRGGIHFIRYLQPGRYYGLDISPSLLEAGWKEVRRAGLTDRLPRENLACAKAFDFSRFPGTFDMALALSVFTHLPFNHIRVCLERLAPAMTSGGKFFASFFEIPPDHATWKAFKHSSGDVTTHGDSDPYHYRAADLEYATRGLPWAFHYIGDVGHARAQRMVLFEKKGG